MPRHATATSFGAKRGNPRNTTKPGPGAPPKSLRLHLADLRRSAKAQLALKEAAEDATSRNFSTAWKLLADYDEDKPAEKKELSGKVEMVVRIEREGRRLTR